MLRRRTPKKNKNAPVTPEPIDPSTIPEAGKPKDEPVSEKVRDLVPNLPLPSDTSSESGIAEGEGIPIEAGSETSPSSGKHEIPMPEHGNLVFSGGR